MPLSYMLDTNICIYITKKKPPSVLQRFQSLTVGEVAMSVITYGELVFGAEKSNNSKRALANLQALVTYIPVLPLPIDSAFCYGQVRADLAKKGKPMGANDLWITAHALSLDVIIVTNNESEFSRVPELKVENWVC